MDQHPKRHRLTGAIAAGTVLALGLGWMILTDGGGPSPPPPPTSPTSALFRLLPDGGWERLPLGQGIPRDHDPDISVKGAVAFASDRSGPFEIWVAEPDAPPAPVTGFNGPVAGSPRWAPDGRRIALTSVADGAPALYIFDRASDKLRPVASDPGSQDRAPAWSRDGQRLYFASNRLGGWRIWITRPPYQEAMPITEEGWLAAKESTDGRWLYMVREGEGGLWRQPADGGIPEPVAPLPAAADSESWLPTRDGVYLLDRDAEGAARLLLLPADGGALRTLATVTGSVRQSTLTLDMQGRPVIAAALP